MYNPEFIALLVGLVATTVLPAMAMLPVEQQSESIIDLGTLRDMDGFFKLMGFHANTTWETIGEPETQDWAAIAAEDAARAAATRSDAPTPENIGFATRQEETKCADDTKFGTILCDNLPTREPWWDIGGSLTIWYSDDRLTNFTNTIAHTTITAQSIKQIVSGSDLEARPGKANQYKFSVPTVAHSTTSNDHDGDESSVNHYIYEEETGIVHYQGTSAALVAELQPPPPPPALGRASRGEDTIWGSKYTTVIQATALSDAVTIVTESCVSSMIKWHIDRASENDRFKCVPLDNQGSWRFALHVNINHDSHNEGEYGKCCD